MWESFVIWVIVPTFDVDSIVRLQLEIFSAIVDNQGLTQISAEFGQVFLENSSLRVTMSPVESVGNPFLSV